MNKRIKTKWIAALRSGKYTQTRQVLRDAKGFCCLGVLCEISKQKTGFGIAENLIESVEEVLGNTIRKWAGLDQPTGALVYIDGALDHLSQHNDNSHTFLEIADAIEKQL